MQTCSRRASICLRWRDRSFMTVNPVLQQHALAGSAESPYSAECGQCFAYASCKNNDDPDDEPSFWRAHDAQTVGPREEC